MFSFLIFFGKMYLKYSSFNFLFPFYQLRVNDKIEIERKNWLFISAFQQMRISIGERKKKKFFLKFITKANNKKSISNDFFYKTVIIHRLKVRGVSKTDTLYLKLFSIQDISCTRQFTPLV